MPHSPLERLRIRSARPAIAAWLIVALCFAQSIGFLHGIAHAGYDQPGRIVASPSDGAAWASVDTSGDERTIAARHSCAAFDAAALGATAPSVPTTLVVSCEATASLVPSASRPTLPVARLAYRSRAPPAFTLA